MTTEATEVELQFPRTVFHDDGVQNRRVEDAESHRRLIAAGCWRDPGLGHAMPEPPPPPPPPMTPEEKAAYDEDRFTGLADQCDGHGPMIADLDVRLTELSEKMDAVISSSLVNAESVNDRLDKLHQRVEAQVGTASGTWGRLKEVEDSVKDQAAVLSDVRNSMQEAAPTLQNILERLTALENRKPKGNQ